LGVVRRVIFLLLSFVAVRKKSEGRVKFFLFHFFGRRAWRAEIEEGFHSQRSAEKEIDFSFFPLLRCGEEVEKRGGTLFSSSLRCRWLRTSR